MASDNVFWGWRQTWGPTSWRTPCSSDGLVSQEEERTSGKVSMQAFPRQHPLSKLATARSRSFVAVDGNEYQWRPGSRRLEVRDAQMYACRQCANPRFKCYDKNDRLIALYEWLLDGPSHARLEIKIGGWHILSDTWLILCSPPIYTPTMCLISKLQPQFVGIPRADLLKTLAEASCCCPSVANPFSEFEGCFININLVLKTLPK
ncbi:hypothetical protein AG1IA_00683 [Rhizoctonia solani AG-1 IA]|uniref:Uncharacterized protein n=1 Tax=Thanatephorus cucumeris (strain AG1-IA) TaxID=983506 RepID=L8X4S7_THACA|nr:hypothetical protein AG1IA_00683 [Rhizoctonia solani AG-1 IA]